ncbi:MAG: zf-HC2 domain-containing protein [Candidatus Limnocylindria bacterium]
MSLTRHDRFEELISASLAGDLTDLERQELDVHLDSCDACRATLASFADQRRIMAGLRHVAPPRDLGARVRSGIETGAHVDVPWWRRPAFAFAGVGGGLAAIAGALLAFVLLNGALDDQQVGGGSGSPAPSVVASTPILPSSEPSTSPAASDAGPSATPNPTPPGTIGFGAINYLEWDGTLADQTLSLHGWDPATETSARLLDLDSTGQPVVAAFSPNSSWLAYQVQNGLKGTNQVIVVELMTGASFDIGETPDVTAFSTRMTWSPDSRYLAYTAADVETGIGPDAWAFDTTDQTWWQLTNSQSTYAASFVPFGEDAGTLLVSQAGAVPVTYRITPQALETREPGGTDGAIEHVFQPILSPSGEHAIFWRGTMTSADIGWAIGEGGMLYVSGEAIEGAPTWSGEPLFPTLTADRDALGSARVAWSYDSNWFAVWSVEWRGTPQTEPGGAPFPSAQEIYFGRAAERQLIDERNASLILAAGETEGVADVAFVGGDLGGDVPSVAVTVWEAPAGESGESPVAQSRLVLAPAGGFDGPTPELGADAAFAGPALYVPQGNEGR